MKMAFNRFLNRASIPAQRADMRPVTANALPSLPYFAGTGAACALCLDTLASSPGDTLNHNLASFLFGMDGGTTVLLAISTGLLCAASLVPMVLNMHSRLGAVTGGFVAIAMTAIFFG